MGFNGKFGRLAAEYMRRYFQFSLPFADDFDTVRLVVFQPESDFLYFKYGSLYEKDMEIRRFFGACISLGQLSGG
jgi:hypothetical protein